MSFIRDFDARVPASMTASIRFDPLFKAYQTALETSGNNDDRIVTLVARSPASAIAQALLLNLGRFPKHTVNVAMIFGDIGPAQSLTAAYTVLENAGIGNPEHSIRWARNRALLEAHERLTLGTVLCWTGDAMRRSEQSRTAIDRVDENHELMQAEALSSFAAIWKASKALPKEVFRRGAQTVFTEETPAFAAFHAHAVDANVINLENYLRGRRH
jgi:hypothetical protein